METRINFLELLQLDMAIKILDSLDDPTDIIRSCCVSRIWHRFVISNGICKKLCLRLFPLLSKVASVMESPSTTRNPSLIRYNDISEWETLEREHRIYAILARILTTSTPSECISEAVSASSTDNYPQESIGNTLDPRDQILRRPTYWSSKGNSNTEVPETLIYKLLTNFCLVTEISVQPFQAYFQLPECPIYSARAVRFRMGHPRNPGEIDNDLRELPLQLPADDKFVWTYTSPEFPMNQEITLQKFKLPVPVLCIGGYLQIELLGRIQKQKMDALYYICVNHVKALGVLSPVFDAEIVEPSGKFLLKYLPENENQPLPRPRQFVMSMLHENLMGLEQILNVWHGNAPDDIEWGDDVADDNDFDFVLM